MKHSVIKVFFVLLLLCSPLPAADQSRLMSIPYAVSTEHVYKVVIESIDGRAQESAVNYPLSAGEHTAEAGKTYQIAGHLDITAPAESQLDGSFWKPIVYRILND